MTRKQALAMLELADSANPDDVKRAYRRLAFALHPDLNPDKSDAAAKFQRVNEAYVFLGEAMRPDSQGAGSARNGEAEATARARADARKAYRKAQSRVNREDGGKAATGAANEARDLGRDDVLRDLLRDPFARRVFEDIYSQIRHETARNRAKPIRPAAGAGERRSAARPHGPSVANPLGEAASAVGSAVGKAVDSVQNWARRQIDDEQTVYLPGAFLAPGARVRLQVSHGLSGRPQSIDITLPPEFQIGRPIRLKGLGRRLGAWKGDLYLRILPGM
jgi:molecular chaperone DnaJ